MKLILHELKTELRHRWWLILLFCLIVLLDFGFLLNWWAPDSYRVRHKSIEWTRNLLLLIHYGITFIAIVPISPLNSKEVDRIRPLSIWQSLGAKILWVTIFFGLPWWIHEFGYVMANGFGFSYAFFAALQRAIVSVYFWLIIGSVGWVLGSVKKGILFTLVGLVVMKWADYQDALGISIPIAESPANRGWNGRDEIASALAWLIPLTFFWIGYWWQRIGSESTKKMWIPVVFGFAAIAPILPLLEKGTEAALYWVSVDKDLEKQISSTIKQEIDNPGAILRSSRPSGAFTWHNDLKITRSNSEILAIPSEARGFISGLNLIFESRFKEHLFKRTHEGEVENLLTKIDAEDLVFLQDMQHSDLFLEKEKLNTDEEKELSDPETKKSGHLISSLELFRFDDLSFLPMNGKSRQFGGMGNSRVHRFKQSSAGTCEIEIRSQRSECILQGDSKLREPKRLFALYFEKQGWVCLLDSQSDRFVIIQERGSSIPVRQTRLKLSEATMPVPLREKSEKFFRNAQLIMLESQFVGIAQERIDIASVKWAGGSSSGYYSDTHLPARPLADTKIDSEKKRLSVLPEKAQPDLIRRHLYETSRIGRSINSFNDSPENEASRSGIGTPVDVKRLIKNIPNQHRDLVRDIVFLSGHGNLAQSLPEEFWRESDREWVLDKMPESYLLRKIATEKKWLLLNSEQLKSLFLDKKTHKSAELLRLGIEAGIEDAKRISTRRFYEEIDYPYSSEGRIFPEHDKKVRTDFETKWRGNWDKVQWAKRLPQRYPLSEAIKIGRLGDEPLLREVLTEILKDGPVLDLEAISSAYNSQGFGISGVDNSPPWNSIKKVITEAEPPAAHPDKTIFDTAKRWLKSEWKYDPETLSYRVLP